MLRIAIQAKGRLNEESVELLAEAGVSIEESKRKLLTRCDDFPLEVLYAARRRHSAGRFDGRRRRRDRQAVSTKWKRKGSTVQIAHKLGFGKCRISLAIPKADAYDGIGYFNGKRVATSYPVILSRFFKGNGINAEIHEIAGSVEIAPSVGMADAIFDIGQLRRHAGNQRAEGGRKKCSSRKR